MNFIDLDLKIKYTTYDDDIINDFYNPILNRSIKYDRAVGYFSSAAFLAYIKGLRGLINNSGKIRLIISPVLTDDDFKVLHDYSNGIKIVTENLFNQYLLNPKLVQSSQILFKLISENVLELKIAEHTNRNGMFHDKIGLFYDCNDNAIAMNGSSNETLSALKNNTESFSVYKSWDFGVSEYVKQHENDFSRYWENQISGIKITDIREILPSEFIEKFKTDDSIDVLYKKIFDEDKKVSKIDFKPYDYQVTAAKSWLKNESGILKMATGTGKTKTAIYINEILKEKHIKLFTVIVVPDITLLNQWSKEMERYYDLVIKCYSKNSNWQKEVREEINYYNFENNSNHLIIVTIQTYFTDRFQKELSRLNKDYLLISDEMHRFGTLNKLKSFIKPNKILGLSATPEIYMNEELTDRLFDLFGGIVFEYNLEQAIKDRRLVEYKYYPIIVDLNESEKDMYRKYSYEIVKMIGHDNESSIKKINPALESLLFKRARLIYGAKNKLIVLEDLIDEIESRGKLVIYSGITSENEVKKNQTNTEEYENKYDDVEFLKQINEVGMILSNKKIQFTRYTSNESENERLEAIRSFENETYSTLLAIRCLDEGVDIPSIERAIILASSSNPREFVQRRGRILRKNRNPQSNKQFAEIYDFVVLQENEDNMNFNSLNKKETERYFEFARLAKNRVELINELEKLKKKYEIIEED